MSADELDKVQDYRCPACEKKSRQEGGNSTARVDKRDRAEIGETAKASKKTGDAVAIVPLH